MDEQERGTYWSSTDGGGAPSLPAGGRSTYGLVEYAGFWRRFAAQLIDWLILYFVIEMVNLVLGVFFQFSFDAGGSPGSLWGALLAWLGVTAAVSITVSWLYFAWMESSSSQATLGKRAFGIVVTDLSGDRISFGRATVRHFAEYLSVATLMIGYLAQAFTTERQALHDAIARTLVVRARPVAPAQPVERPSGGVA